MHSRKKRITPLTSEEISAEKLRLEKIQRLHKMIFDEIQSGEYTDEGFNLSEKAMTVSPDIYTFINFRRNHLLARLENSDISAKVNILVLELDLLTKIIKESPKSYTLWFHRQWVLQQSQNITEIIQRELMLCDYMLKKDNRNFHVWNYRSWVVELEGNQSLNEELEFTKTMICRDFSNFSAWHYRTKVLKKMHANSIPVDFIQSELSMLKNAYFTCPNDQSVWNYHRWILLGLESIKIVGIAPSCYSTPPLYLLVGFSHSISNLNSDIIGISNDWEPIEGVWEPYLTKPFSYIWKFTPLSPITGALEIRLSPLNKTAGDCDGNKKLTGLLYKYKKKNEVYEFFIDGVEDNNIFESELASINELLDIEDDDITQVLLRKAQILEVLAYSVNQSEYIDLIVDCYTKLKTQDPRHAVFYQESLDAFICLKYKKKPKTDFVSQKLQAKLLILE
jgi:Protein prenyltransferase alpha subunit repeat